MSEPENPSAFPTESMYSRYQGMTLRDYFAGRCIEQCIRNSLNVDDSWDPANVAYHAYLIADAMLAARRAEFGNIGADGVQS